MKNEISTIINNKLNDSQLYTIYGGKLARYVLLRYDMELWDLEAFLMSWNDYGRNTYHKILLKIVNGQSTFNDMEREELTNKLKI